MKKYEKYKDSGVEWIGEIPEGWEVRKLKYFFKLKSGESPKKNNNGKFPIYGANGVIGLSSKSNSEEGTLLIGRVGSSGEINKTKEKCWVSDNALIVYKINCNKIFLRHLLSSIDLKSIVNSNAQPLITSSQIKVIKSIFPSIQEQQKIASFLDEKSKAIENFIKNKKKLIELLEEEKKTIITNAVTKGINPDVSYKKSGVEWIGDIPEHWEVTKLKYLTTKIVDGAHFTPTYLDKGVPFLRVTDLTSKKIDLDTVKRIPEKEHKSLIKRCNPKKGDILLSKNGTIGVTKVIDWDYDFSIFVSLCLIKFNAYLNPNYFEIFFKSFIIEEQLFSSSKVTSVTNLHLDKIKELLIVFPTDIKEQKQIVTYIEQESKKIDDLKEKYQKEIDLIKEYKEKLIYDVVTGKMNIQDYEIH